MDQALELLLRLPKHLHWAAADFLHRRGAYLAKPMGNSFGGGRKTPGKLVNHPEDEKLLKELFASEPFRRMAGFADGEFLISCLGFRLICFEEQLRKYFPGTWQEYEDTLTDIIADDPTLVRAFDNSAFAACHVNFPPNAWTRLHTDHLNLVRGLCAVWVMGRFDPKKGGHLILWDLKIIVEFPPGNLILLPSALVMHGNISIEQDSVRCSFVLYSAAGLFRWVHNGFQSDADFVHNASAEERAQWEEFRQGLLERNLEVFPVWEEVAGKP